MIFNNNPVQLAAGAYYQSQKPQKIADGSIFGKKSVPGFDGTYTPASAPSSAATASGALGGASDKDNQLYNAQEAATAREWSAAEAQKSRDFNAAEAQKNRDFQERMSNSAYQRAKEDMIKAGLNPYLAYGQGGASAPSGSSASSSAASGYSASYSGVNSGIHAVSSGINSASNLLSSFARLLDVFFD